ncbi:hypothetical protein [Pseudomonas cichorii]|uniref:hypothetical protein n=1 Tax=Pseudomonas cichorii TaxID=36746 RepID=UPI0021AA8685|nr:hypothetical protein [Pseudomonas cichorii]
MTLDIRGSIKNTKLSSNPYVVFEELISNSIDSYLIRKHSDQSVESLQITITVDLLSDLIGGTESVSVSCVDNGCGFGDDQLKAFLTKDTSYKDDLSISGIGRCKGAGRIQFFHHFSSLSIDSTFRQGRDLIRREMHYKEPQKQIDAHHFTSDSGSTSAIGTSFKLSELKDNIRSRTLPTEGISNHYSASTLKKTVLVTFLQRLIGLENQLGQFEISFTTHQSGAAVQNELLTRADLPIVTSERIVQIKEQDPKTGTYLNTTQNFKVSHYQLDARQYGLPKNSIALCAKSSPVKDITHRYLRTRAEQNNPVHGLHHIVLIESDYLDQSVNEQRDNFENIPEEIPSGEIFSTGKISYASIYDAIDLTIHEMVVPTSWNKETVLLEIIEQFGITEAMLHDTSTRIMYGESAHAVAERVLKKYQERVVDETVEIFNLKEEIINTEPDTDEFRIKINELSWKYTSSLKNFDMANLSQLIVRRAAIVQILDLACSKSLKMQQITDNTKRKDERIIHSIFFPMRKDSSDVSDHDIWLLSEEYHYYDYIASDMPLSSITWDDGKKLFDEDIDKDFMELLAKRASDNGGKRPDIALFSKEGSAIILEFKAPGVYMDDHIGDLSEYAQLLAAKSGGKLKKIYGYLIGDTVNPLRLNGWTPFPTGNGWFQSGALLDHRTRYPLGETYFEILHFADVIKRAKKRIGIYQSKLKLNLEPEK